MDKTAVMIVPPTGYAAARCFYRGHDLHEDGPDRRVCDRCGLGWILAATERGDGGTE